MKRYGETLNTYLSKRHQPDKTAYSTIPTTWHFRKNKPD